MDEINYDSARGDVITYSGIEVGQVYECKETTITHPQRRFHIQGFCTTDGDKFPNVSVRLFVESEPRKNSDGIMHGWVTTERISDFLNSATLITNADGTPHGDYRDGDVWVFCGQSGKSMGDSYLIKTVHGVKMVSSRDIFKPISDTAFPQLPHEYKLIYREGQGVIND